MVCLQSSYKDSDCHKFGLKVSVQAVQNLSSALKSQKYSISLIKNKGHLHAWLWTRARQAATWVTVPLSTITNHPQQWPVVATKCPEGTAPAPALHLPMPTPVHLEIHFSDKRETQQNLHIFSRLGKYPKLLPFFHPITITGNNCFFLLFSFFILLLSLFNIILSNWQRKTETGRKILHALPYRWKGESSYMIQVSRIEGLRHRQFISFNPSDYMEVIRLQNVIHSDCLVLIFTSVPKKRKAIFHSHSSDSIQVSRTKANEVIDSGFASTC